MMSEEKPEEAGPPNESQLGNQGEADPHCLKCGKSIAHNIPYKYEGKTFHARCLVCNFCGRNLVGKPFIIEEQSIFCGDVCKQSYEAGPSAETNVSQLIEESNDESGLNDSQNESLMEALDSINGTDTEEPKLPLSRPLPSYHHPPDPDQITDYPRASPDIASSLISLDGSRRSSLSLSAVSESSLTSDYSYDASRKPSKRILKHPHRPKRRSRKNVRWQDEADTTSIDSFDSTSTSSSIYARARNGMMETRQNWREFERAPPPGSTGITPIRQPLASRYTSRPSSAPYASHGSPSSYVPELEPMKEHVQSASTSNLLHPAHAARQRFNRSPSPQSRHSRSRSPSPQTRDYHSPSPRLQASPLTSTPSYGDSGFEKLSRPVQSPSRQRNMRRYVSDTAVQRSPSPHYAHDPPPNAAKKPDDIDTPLVLKFNESKIPELEASTIEDRQRMHIFKFPQQKRQNSEPAKPAHSSTSTPVRTAFLNDDDEGDYDHLSPILHNSQTKKDTKGHALIAGMVKLREKKVDRNSRSKLISYTEDDLDDALKAIAETDSHSSSSQGTSPTSENPPPVPVKHKRGRLTPTETSKPRASGLQRSGSDPTKNPASSHTRQPPPVPPKLHRIKRDDSFHGRAEDNILPPPPEFASFDFQNEISSPKSDDVLNSASTSTLVEEQEISPTNTGRQSQIHPKVSPPSHVGQSWSDSFPLKLNDRIVVGAEDPLQLGDSKPSSSKYPQSSITTQRFSHDHRNVNSGQRSNHLEAPHGSKYKLSMETAFNEGNLLKNNVFAPRNHPSEHPKRIPQRPAPLPPTTRKVSAEEHRVLTGGRQQPSKQVDPSVIQLLSDLDIDESPHAHGTCTVCSKPIQTSRECITFNSHSHHSKCFYCIKCRSFLQDKKPCYCHGKLYCRECYVGVTSNSFYNSNSSAYRDYNRPSTGGQITTV